MLMCSSPRPSPRSSLAAFDFENTSLRRSKIATSLVQFCGQIVAAAEALCGPAGVATISAAAGRGGWAGVLADDGPLPPKPPPKGPPAVVAVPADPQAARYDWCMQLVRHEMSAAFDGQLLRVAKPISQLLLFMARRHIARLQDSARPLLSH